MSVWADQGEGRGAQAPSAVSWKEEHVLLDQEDGGLNPCCPRGSTKTLGNLFKLCELPVSYLSIGVEVYALLQMVWPFLPLEEHLAISEDIFGYHNWCHWPLVGRAWAAVKHPTMHRMVFPGGQWLRTHLSIPESGRSPAEGNDNPLQYSCLGNPMDRGAWWAMVLRGLRRAGHD